MKSVLLIFMISFTLTVFSQSDQSQIKDQRQKMIEEFMKSRKHMMDKMLDAFGKDDFFDDDMDADFFKSILGDRFKPFNSGFGSMVTTEEIKNNDGSIDIFIKPKDESVQLDIQTTKTAIVIKGKRIEKVENKAQGTSSTSMSNSSFSQSIGIPFGYTASNPEAIQERIRIKLKPDAKRNISPGKTPIQKRVNEDTL